MLAQTARWLSTAHQSLVLTTKLLAACAGVDIADDGTFLFREAVRINFGHLVAQQFDGDIVNVSCCLDSTQSWGGGVPCPVRLMAWPRELVGVTLRPLPVRLVSVQSAPGQVAGRFSGLLGVCADRCWACCCDRSRCGVRASCTTCRCTCLPLTSWCQIIATM